MHPSLRVICAHLRSQRDQQAPGNVAAYYFLHSLVFAMQPDGRERRAEFADELIAYAGQMEAPPSPETSVTQSSASE